ncbi:MAG: glycosyltransferase, partial [Thiotrichales bacterium]|nr:glycosyltransferase [Thiotrichales bacterium]
ALPIYARKIHVIHRGVDSREFPYDYQPPDAWRSDWQQQHPQLDDCYVLTAPARITRWKGQEDFIRIIAGLREAGIPVHGLIAGGAHPRRQKFLRQLRAQVEQHGLEDRISFLGQRRDMREIMAVSDLVLSLAREPEAFGRTALEALCLGVPVIAYDHGGAAEVLERMFPQGRVEPMNIQQAIERAIAFYRSRPRPDNNNCFPRQNMLDQTLGLYEACVQ